MVKRKFVFNFFFFLLVLYLVKGKFFNIIMELIDDVEVSSGQLKGFYKSLIDPKYLLKVEATSFCFDNNLSFSSNINSCILLFLFEKYGLHVFQNGLELNQHQVSQSTGIWLIYSDLPPWKVLLKLDNLTRIFIILFFGLVFETWSGHYLLVKVLIKTRFLIPS